MKTFIVLQGKEATVREHESIDDAHSYCVNFLDHSKGEIIVREVTNFQFKKNKSMRLLELEQEWKEAIKTYNRIHKQYATAVNVITSISGDMYEEQRKLGVIIKKEK